MSVLCSVSLYSAASVESGCLVYCVHQNLPLLQHWHPSQATYKSTQKFLRQNSSVSKHRSKMSLPSNFSVLAIPAYYGLSLLPHMIALHVASGGNPAKWDNRCPRAAGLKAKLQSKLSTSDFALYERGESASANCYENQALFFATIAFGHLAGLEKSYLNNFALRYLLVRAAYVVSYVAISNQSLTPIRTGLYFWAVGQCIKVLLKSAEKLA